MPKQTLLGLPPIQQKILKQLSDNNNYKITTLSKILKYPRTSVEYNLRKLKNNHLVSQLKINNHKEWIINKREDAVKKTSTFLSLFNSKNPQIINVDNITIEVYKSKEELENVYKIISKLSISHRIFAIQGNQSAIKQFSKFSKQYLKDIHNQQRKNKIVIEGVTSQGAWDNFKKQDTDIIQSHFGRPTILYLVPDELIDFDLDVIFVHDDLYLIQTGEETITCIKSNSLTNALLNIFKIYKKIGIRIDINEFIKQKKL